MTTPNPDIPTPHTGPPLLVCPPTSVGPPAVSAVARRCSICDTETWVFCAMAPVVDAGDALPCCWRCVTAHVTAGAHLIPVQHPRLRASGLSEAQLTDTATRILAHLAEPPTRS